MRGQRIGKGYDSSYQIEGLERLVQKLNLLPETLREKVIKNAVWKAFEPALEACQALCPVDTSPYADKLVLKTSLHMEVRKNKSGGYTALVIAGKEGEGDFVGDFYYLGMIEYGTWKMEARPFMRPAFDQTKETVIANLKRLLADGIAVEFQKAA